LHQCLQPAGNPLAASWHCHTAQGATSFPRIYTVIGSVLCTSVHESDGVNTSKGTQQQEI
jgi:hypothetical protein